MGSSYKTSKKELLEIRNKIFVENGIPELIKNGYEESPFSTSWFEKYDLGGYTYTLTRLSEESKLEILTADISRGDNWIKLNLNIFQLKPSPRKLREMEEKDALIFFSLQIA